MSDMRELIPELDLIPIDRTSLMPAEEPKRDPVPIRKKRNRAIRGIEITAAVSLALNVIQLWDHICAAGGAGIKGKAPV